MQRVTCCTILFLLLASGTSRAQQDSLRKDDKFYQNIEQAAKKGKVTHFLHSIFFRPVNVSKSQQRKQRQKKDLQRPYRNYEGRIIRDIHILTLDPFGYSLNDTAAHNGGF